MRVLNVNSTLSALSGGGTAERTFQLSRHLALNGVATTILTLDIDLDERRRSAVAPAALVALPCLWRRFYLPRSGWGAIRRLVAEADVIHVMGHWDILNVLVYLAARRARKPYVISPAGALPLFGRSLQLKKLFNWLVGHAIVRNAAAWIAITEGEAPQFAKYGIASERVTVIPNGINATDFPAVGKQSLLQRYNLPDLPYILFMGRLNPIKGPDLLLRAYAQAYLQFPDCHLLFAGPDGGMLEGLLHEAKQAGLADRIHFIGHIGGLEKVAAYRHARLLVVPSRQEAMSIVALEAGVCGTPVLLTDQCGFSEVREIDPRLEVPATVEGLASGLISLLGDETLLDTLAPVWRDFVLQQYSWERTIQQFIALFQSLVVREATK